MRGGCAQDMYDEQTGRKVRKARQAAATAIAEHAKWVAHNPYRLAEGGKPGGGTNGTAAADVAIKEEPGEDGGAADDGDDAEDWVVAPSRVKANGAGLGGEKRTKSQSSFKRSGVDDGDDDDAFADGAVLCWRAWTGCVDVRLEAHGVVWVERACRRVRTVPLGDGDVVDGA